MIEKENLLSDNSKLKDKILKLLDRSLEYKFVENGRYYNFVSEGDDSSDAVILENGVSGVYYIYYNGRDEKNIGLKYIGEATCLRSRLRTHFRNENVFWIQNDSIDENIDTNDFYVKIIETSDDLHIRQFLEQASYVLLVDKTSCSKLYNMALNKGKR